MSAAASVRATQRVASGSSFYWAMRLLPGDEREAMYAIYGFCRAVDDIADDVASASSARMAGLQAWRDEIKALFGDRVSPKTVFLRSAARRYGLREQDFVSVIEGMEMDVNQAMRAPDLATLDHYCDCVASAVGRLSIKVFGMDEAPGFTLAHHLGRGLQLTNILRDLDEDAELGRLYLPREFLERASIVIDTPSQTISDPAIDPVCRALAEVARQHYREADHILRSRPRGDLRPPRLMGAVYSAMLSRMQNRGWFPPRQHKRVSKSMLIWLLLRHGLAA